MSRETCLERISGELASGFYTRKELIARTGFMENTVDNALRHLRQAESPLIANLRRERAPAGTAKDYLTRNRGKSVKRPEAVERLEHAWMGRT